MCPGDVTGTKINIISEKKKKRDKKIYAEKADFTGYLKRRENRQKVSLLSDTELGEDIPQYLVCGDFSGDLAQVVEHLADIQGQQVGGESGFHSLMDPVDGIPCIHECFKVAGIGDYDIILVVISLFDGVYQERGQLVYISPVRS